MRLIDIGFWGMMWFQDCGNMREDVTKMCRKQAIIGLKYIPKVELKVMIIS